MAPRKNDNDDLPEKSYSDGQWFLDIDKDQKLTIGEIKDWGELGYFYWPYVRFDTIDELRDFLDFISDAVTKYQLGIDPDKTFDE